MYLKELEIINVEIAWEHTFQGYLFIILMFMRWQIIFDFVNRC